MRLIGWLLCAVVMCAAQSCGAPSAPKVESVNVVSVEQSEGSPSRVVVAVGLDNKGYGAKLLEGRIRISYKGRNVVILSLTESVKIAPRRSVVVELPLRVSIAHNSSAVAFREAISRGEVSEVKVSWQAKARVAGVKRSQIELQPTPIAELLSAEQIEQLCRAFNDSVID